MKIGIIGQGFVGTAVREGFKNFFDVETFDINKESTCTSTKEVCDKSDITFVCLPTPMKKDGSCYTGIVENVIKELQCKIAKFLLPVDLTVSIASSISEIFDIPVEIIIGLFFFVYQNLNLDG